MQRNGWTISCNFFDEPALSVSLLPPGVPPECALPAEDGSFECPSTVSGAMMVGTVEPGHGTLELAFEDDPEERPGCAWTARGEWDAHERGPYFFMGF